MWKQRSFHKTVSPRCLQGVSKVSPRCACVVKYRWGHVENGPASFSMPIAESHRQHHWLQCHRPAQRMPFVAGWQHLPCKSDQICTSIAKSLPCSENEFKPFWWQKPWWRMISDVVSPTALCKNGKFIIAVWMKHDKVLVYICLHNPLIYMIDCTWSYKEI